MSKRNLPLFLFIIFFALCVFSQLTPVLTVPREDYEIYRVTSLRAAKDTLRERPTRFIFLDTTFTSGAQPGCFSDENLRQVYADAFEDLRTNDKTARRMANPLPLGPRYGLVTDVDLQKMKVRVHFPASKSSDAQDGAVFLWENFFERFPGSHGYIGFSAVGYSRDRKRAVVSVNFLCGDLCALATDYLLERDKHGWRVIAKGTCGSVS